MAIKGDMGRPCVVYMVTNKVTGKRYIGVSAQKYLETRISQHFARAKRRISNGAFDRALRKYDREAFEWVILEKCKTVTDALIREVALIACMKPEYNSTAGGDGARGHRMTAEGRKRVSEANKGRPWHGHPLHAEARERLSFHGKSAANLARLAAISARPRHNARAVVCLDDGKIYPSVADAARVYGADIGTMVRVCQRKKSTVKGRVFRYDGDHLGGVAESVAVKAARTRTSEKRPVVCLNDNMLFETKKIAAEFYGIGTNTVARSCADDGNIMHSGLAFNFLDEWCPNPL